MIDWDKLKPNTGLREGFEELCCQLAWHESAPQGSIFVRKGSPDAGVECYWKLPDGSMWGWQAKFFRNSLNASQWRQIDESVRVAKEKHPELIRYVVCLPMNRGDGRKKGEKSCQKKWDEHVKKWREGSNIKFEYWGTSEITGLLIKEEYQGMSKYFFDKEFLSKRWFEMHVKGSIESAGPRYSEKMNVELPIVNKFEILGRTERFYQNLEKHSHNIREYFNRIKSTDIFQKNEIEQLNSNIYVITDTLENMKKNEQDKINFKKFNENGRSAFNIIFEAMGKTINKINKVIHTNKFKHNNREREYLLTLFDEFTKLGIYMKNSNQILNAEALILHGKAGTGKTHLLCDIVNSRLQTNQFGILLHGARFDNRSVKIQIIEQLDLKCTFEELLEALQSIGQAYNSKTLVVIDALNESENYGVWKKYLSELVSTVNNYPWVGIVVSLRTPYQDYMIDENLQKKSASIEHVGFGDTTDIAVKKILEYNGIMIPSIPILDFEFSNPQFLNILCKGLRNNRLKNIPEELEGITSVYDYFIESVNESLSRDRMLRFEKEEKIVQKAVEKIAEYMAEKNTRFIKYDIADKILKNIYQKEKRSLLHHMISEGILKKYPTKEDSSMIEFAYERLGDNLIVGKLLECITRSRIPEFISKNYIKYFENSSQQIKYSGMINAMSIQFPEKYNKELIEMHSSFLKSKIILESFLDSLLWRRSSKINKTTIGLVNELLRRDDYFWKLFENLIRLSTKPQNPLNAKYLHKHLIGLDMAERDSTWSIFLNSSYDKENNPVKQYIDWAWDSDKTKINKDTVHLASLVLSWFLTSSNRPIRDRATKALILLLSDNVDILAKILSQFRNCDDLYVKERLFCVAYGCAVRNTDNQLKKIAEHVYSLVFKNGKPPEHLLLREYAKAVIDYATHQNIEIDIDYKKIEPPYNSKWIVKFPDERKIKRLLDKHTSKQRSYNGASWINYSLSTMGDFYRYVIGESPHNFQWSEIPLLPGKQSRETKYEEFCKTITAKQEKNWKKYLATITKKSEKINKNHNKNKITREHNEFDDSLVNYEKKFRNELNKEHQRIFDAYVAPYVRYWGNPEPKYFELRKLALWIINRVFELGWTREKFGRFDSFASRNKPRITTDTMERIGKKYQWIAYHELLSKISDNFEFNAILNNSKFAKYYGIRQLLNKRDIDPSLLLSETFDNDELTGESSWWFSFKPIWCPDSGNIDWMKDSSGLSLLKSTIKVTNKNDGTEWLVLNSFFNMKYFPSKIADSYRGMFFITTSYICKKSDAKKLYNWGKKQGYDGGRFPDHETVDTYLSELHSEQTQQIINEAELFKKPRYFGLPAGVVATGCKYEHEKNDRDASARRNFGIYLPSNLLVKKMNLTNNLDGSFVNAKDKLIAYDPSVKEIGPSSLLVRKDQFIKFLHEHNYEIIWQVIGQKQILHKNVIFGDWKGCLNIQGTYRMIDGKICGSTNTKYLDKELIGSIH